MNTEGVVNKERGASTQAIQHHYDLSNEFYQLWLDSSSTYSCALWDDVENLEDAQEKKLEYHIAESKAGKSKRVLDIGCGWGSTLKRLVENHQVEKAIGLTLSQSQVDWISSLKLPQVEVILKSWAEHTPEAPYDAIISIGAFEHFVHLTLSAKEKAVTYRDFFQRCHQWLKPRGQISLQTIIYENASIEDSNSFLAQDIFPESNLPHLSEIAKATEGLFEFVVLRNDRDHYTRTLRIWLKNLRANRAKALQLVGEEKVARYEKYLSLCMIGFHSANLNLSRITLRRIDEPRLKN